MEITKNNHEQHTRRNNIEIQGIPATVADGYLENKVIDIFRCLKININPSDIEDCHRLDNLIHSTWSSKSLIKIRKSMNENQYQLKLRMIYSIST